MVNKSGSLQLPENWWRKHEKGKVPKLGQEETQKHQFHSKVTYRTAPRTQICLPWSAINDLPFTKRVRVGMSGPAFGGQSRTVTLGNRPKQIRSLRWRVRASEGGWPAHGYGIKTARLFQFQLQCVYPQAREAQAAGGRWPLLLTGIVPAKQLGVLPGPTWTFWRPCRTRS